MQDLKESQFIDDEAEEITPQRAGFESESDMEDEIDDLVELSESDAGELVDTEFTTARNMRQQLPTFMKRPDVLAYLNSFKDLDDHDRARLCRGVANYLQNSMNTRNGVFRRRKESRGQKVVTEWKKTKRPRKNEEEV